MLAGFVAACSIAGRSIFITPNPANICAPDTIVLQQHIDAVCSYLEANPLELGRGADILVQNATALKWPCAHP